MAQLTVNFTPVPGITSYNICYVPVGGGTLLCVEESQSPVVITAGITCGVSYDVTVSTNCPVGEYSTDTSTPISTVAVGIDCPPPATCMSYTISTYSASGQTTTYRDCNGVTQQQTIGGVSGYDASTFCALEGTVVLGNETTLVENGVCAETVGICYTIDVPYEDLQSEGKALYFHYTDPNGGYTLITTQMIPVIDTGTGIRFAVCSTSGAPAFRYSQSGNDMVIPGIIVNPGSGCNSSSACQAEINA